MRFLDEKLGDFEKLSKGSKSSDITSKGLGEVFEGDSADTCAGKFLLVSMGGRANGQACADGERGPPSARAEILYIAFKPEGASLNLRSKIFASCRHKKRMLLIEDKT